MEGGGFAGSRLYQRDCASNDLGKRVGLILFLIIKYFNSSGTLIPHCQVDDWWILTFLAELWAGCTIAILLPVASQVLILARIARGEIWKLKSKSKMQIRYWNQESFLSFRINYHQDPLLNQLQL